MHFCTALGETHVWVSRCEHINEYEMTQHSLHAAVSIGLDSGEHSHEPFQHRWCGLTTCRTRRVTCIFDLGLFSLLFFDAETIISRLSMLCKTKLPSSIERFIRGCTSVYGKVKMVIVDDKFYLETPSRDIYNTLTNVRFRVLAIVISFLRNQLQPCFSACSPRHSHNLNVEIDLSKQSSHYIYIYIYLCVCVCVCMYVYVYVCMYIYILMAWAARLCMDALWILSTESVTWDTG